AAKLPLVAMAGAAAEPFRSGGFFDAGVLGSALAAWLWARRAGLAFLPLVDRLIPAAPLACAVGRLGCLAAGCCWGIASTAPWALVYRDPRASSPVFRSASAS